LQPSAEIEHRECDAPEADRQEDDAAPIEIGFIAAGFILSLRITVGFWHKGKRILSTKNFTMNKLAMQNSHAKGAWPGHCSRSSEGGSFGFGHSHAYIVATHCVARRFR